MRNARDKVLRRVSAWLIEIGFQSAGTGHFTRTVDDLTWHVGFQKHSSGRDVRVMCHIDNGNGGDPIVGPWNDKYAFPDSPNGVRYLFSWSTLEVDIEKSAEEYCKYINEVVIPWFKTVPRRN